MPLVARLYRRRPDLPLAAEAAGWLFLAWLMAGLLPVRRLAHSMLRAPSPAQGYDEAATIARVRWAVQAASRRVPWRSACLHQAIAAQRMLCRRGIAVELVFGVARDDAGRLQAHAWAKAGEITVVGGEVADRFSRLATFRAGGGL
jgi:hypothetical protein